MYFIRHVFFGSKTRLTHYNFAPIRIYNYKILVIRRMLFIVYLLHKHAYLLYFNNII